MLLLFWVVCWFLRQLCPQSEESWAPIPQDSVGMC